MVRQNKESKRLCRSLHRKRHSYHFKYTDGQRFATPEPLGPGGDPYPAMNGKPDEELLDKLVSDTVSYWREREKQIKSLV